MKCLRLVFAILLMVVATPQGVLAQHTAADSTLARQLGADSRGMHRYVMALLREGAMARHMDTTVSNPLLRGHLENITKLANTGKLVLAGPFLDDTSLEGIFIFNVETVAEAEKLVATDPAVRAQLFSIELHPWYGPASLQEVVPLHRRITLGAQ